MFAHARSFVVVVSAPWRRGSRTLGCALALFSACQFDTGDIPVDPGNRHDAGPARDAQASDARTDEHDAGSDGATHGTIHSGCDVPLSEPWPEPKGITVDLTGRPSFDLYRDTACDALKNAATCVAEDNACHGSDFCFTEPDRGVCVNFDLQLASIFSIDDGRCLAGATPEDHALACCQKLPGYDCRGPWPYAHDGKHGQLCARNADCEPGLACKHYHAEPNANHVVDVGLCMCPDEDAQTERCL